MSAILKASSLVGAFALTGAAASYSMRSSSQDFSRHALHAAELNSAAPAIKKQLPTNFFQFSLGEYKISNHRA